MRLQDKLEPVLDRYRELSALLAEGCDDPKDFIRMSKEYAEMTPVVECLEAYKKAVEDYNGLEEMLADPEMDKEMRLMTEEEMREIKAALPDMEKGVQIALLPKDSADSKNAILEIRAGTGGDEAALFAADLFAMYRGYAGELGWKVEIVEASSSEAGGYKQIIAQVSGSSVFSKLKYESGAHRVQRVPKTESQGRVHTSAATVAVLPEAEDVDIDIRTEDLRIDTYRAQGAGGQHVNTTDSAVRITHLPTGVVVEMQDERSQHKNKDKAMKILRTRIYDAERQRLADERAAERKGQVGSGDRSERIRTYNFPQGRVTDHRINLTLYRLEKVMTGEDLGEIIDALIAHEQAEQLASLVA